MNYPSIDLFEMGDSTARDGGDNSLSERNVAEEVSRLVEQSKELQESASTLISRNSQEESSLRQRALALDSNIKMLRTFIGSSVKKGNLDSKHAEKVSPLRFQFTCAFYLYQFRVANNTYVSMLKIQVIIV